MFSNTCLSDDFGWGGSLMTQQWEGLVWVIINLGSTGFVLNAVFLSSVLVFSLFVWELFITTLLRHIFSFASSIYTIKAMICISLVLPSQFQDPGNPVNQIWLIVCLVLFVEDIVLTVSLGEVVYYFQNMINFWSKSLSCSRVGLKHSWV